MVFSGGRSGVISRNLLNFPYKIHGFSGKNKIRYSNSNNLLKPTWGLTLEKPVKERSLSVNAAISGQIEGSLN